MILSIIEKDDGEVEAVGSVGRGGSVFGDGEYGDVGSSGDYGLPFSQAPRSG